MNIDSYEVFSDALLAKNDPTDMQNISSDDMNLHGDCFTSPKDVSALGESIWVKVLKLAHAFHNYDRGANLFHCITECNAIMREMVENGRTSNYYPFPSKTFALLY